MHKKEDIAKAIGVLQIAFKDALPEERYQLYVEVLSDIHPVTLMAAVKRCLKKYNFLPTIAEITNEAEYISNYVNNREQREAVDAWGLVMKAVGSWGYERGLEHLEGIVLETAKPLWRDICYNEEVMVSRAHFMKAYEEKVRRTKERNKVAKVVDSIPVMKAARQKAVQTNAQLQLYAKIDELAEKKSMEHIGDDKDAKKLPPVQQEIQSR